MTRVRTAALTPLQKLRLVARHAEKLGEHDIAFQVTRVARAVVAAANTEVVLDSWPEFESWFLKNRSQGLEFVFADKYGEDAEETQAIKQLLEGYDLLERQLNELYQKMHVSAGLGTKAEPEEAEEPEAEEPAAEEGGEEALLPEEGEAGEESLGEQATEEVEGEEAAAAEEEAASEEEAAAEEAFEPAKEASVKDFEAPETAESKMVVRLQKLMARADVPVVSVGFRGQGTYRVTCASADDGSKAEHFLASTGWKHTRTAHPTGKVLFDVTPRDV